MATLKIKQVVETTKEIEIEVTYPFYIKDKHGKEFIIHIDESKYIKVSTILNAIYECELQLEYFIKNNWTPCKKYEFNEALEKVSKNIDNLYEQVLQAQVQPMVKDECDQRADLEDAKGQEQLENYLGK